MGNKSDSLVLIRIPFSKSWHGPALKSVTSSLGGIMWTPETETMERMKTPFWKCLLCSWKSEKKEKQTLQLQTLFITEQMLQKPLFAPKILQPIKEMAYV